MNFLKSVYQWPFLQEPLYRWAIFVVAMIFIFATWATVIKYMQD